MNNVWNPLVETVGTIKDSIGKKFEEAYKVVTDIWNGLSKWFKDNIQTPIVKVAGAISDGFSKAFNWVKKIFDKAGDGINFVVKHLFGDPDKKPQAAISPNLPYHGLVKQVTNLSFQLKITGDAGRCCLHRLLLILECLLCQAAAEQQVQFLALQLQ